jgi:hypothetical protein
MNDENYPETSRADRAREDCSVTGATRGIGRALAGRPGLEPWREPDRRRNPSTLEPSRRARGATHPRRDRSSADPLGTRADRARDTFASNAGVSSGGISVRAASGPRRSLASLESVLAPIRSQRPCLLTNCARRPYRGLRRSPHLLPRCSRPRRASSVQLRRRASDDPRCRASNSRACRSTSRGLH